ncbi:MAG: class I SAM-dependent methyltransferase [Acidimicrobiaceae bacterium]|nr:class I SAM-dependent methyltransferase [Acidimicrobiaceae bacterium]
MIDPRADYLEVNRRWWDEAARLHVDTELYPLAEIVAGLDPRRPFEDEEFGEVDGLDLLHLQCHLGTDTLGWARRGARVTGYDLSGESLRVARELFARSGVPGNFVEGPVTEAVERLGEESFDVIYTGIGALNWLADLTEWAKVVWSLLRPGGRLYLVEFHPLLGVLREEEPVLEPSADYFYDPAGLVSSDPGDYAAFGAVREHSTAVEWQHHLGAVIQSLLRVGLRLEYFAEHDGMSFAPWPEMERLEGQLRWRLGEGRPRLPLEYSLIAHRP